jgi:hypothetical protein
MRIPDRVLPNAAQAARVQGRSLPLLAADITIPKAASRVEQLPAAATPNPERGPLQEIVSRNKKVAAAVKIIVEYKKETCDISRVSFALVKVLLAVDQFPLVKGVRGILKRIDSHILSRVRYVQNPP